MKQYRITVEGTDYSASVGIPYGRVTVAPEEDLPEILRKEGEKLIKLSSPTTVIEIEEIKNG